MSSTKSALTMLARMRGGKHVAPFEIFTSAMGIEHWLKKQAKKQALNIFKVDNLLKEKGFRVTEKHELNGQVRLFYRNSKNNFSETLIVDLHSSSGAMKISLASDPALVERNFQDGEALMELLSNTKHFEEFSVIVELACKHSGWVYELVSDSGATELETLESMQSFKLRLHNDRGGRDASISIGVMNGAEFCVHAVQQG